MCCLEIFFIDSYNSFTVTLRLDRMIILQSSLLEKKKTNYSARIEFSTIGIADATMCYIF